MAGRIRLRGSALAWKRCSPGNDAPVGLLACGRSGPLVGNVLWWEMSSHRKCPLVGLSLPLHFSPLRQEKASGGKSPVVGTKLWWCLPHLFSNASLSSKLSSPKTSHSSLPTTSVPQVFSFRPLLLHKGLLHTVLFPPLLFLGGDDAFDFQACVGLVPSSLARCLFTGVECELHCSHFLWCGLGAPLLIGRSGSGHQDKAACLEVLRQSGSSRSCTSKSVTGTQSLSMSAKCWMRKRAASRTKTPAEWNLVKARSSIHRPKGAVASSWRPTPA